jgi:hypothetical protein
MLCLFWEGLRISKDRGDVESDVIDFGRAQSLIQVDVGNSLASYTSQGCGLRAQSVRASIESVPAQV